MKKTFLMMALALPGGAALPAANAQQLPATLDACANLQDAAQRLSCYDREVAALRKAVVAATPRPTPAPTAPAVAATTPAPATARPATEARPASAVFGQELLGKNARAEDKVVYEDLHAKIASLHEIRPGEYRITLDNDQTWKQTEAAYAFELKVGEPVTLKRATLGSYRLYRDTGNGKQWVRVTRTR
jgi:hypothetical protein